MELLDDLRKKYYDLFKEELNDYCIPFWLKYGWDKENGGLLNCLDREGKVFSYDKAVWMDGRCAWMYAHLSNLYGENKEYLSFSKSCLDFLNKYCFDSDSRMYFKVTRDGLPLRKRRYWFSESFYVIASIEYYKATRDIKYLSDARKIYDLIANIYNGSITDPFKIFPKTYPETRSFKSMAEPMILLNVSSIMRKYDKERESYYNKNIDLYLDEIKHHYNKDLEVMLENITLDNKYLPITSDGRIVNPGHDMECSLFLLQEALYRNDKDLEAFAEKVFINAINLGWDKEYGGIFYFKDAEGMPVESYEHDMKLWWPHNEGMVASLLLYKTTGKDIYKEWFIKITDYAFSHFSDREYGEWYGYLRRDGLPTMPPCKGCTYKGPFHVMRCLSSVIQIFDNKDF